VIGVRRVAVGGHNISEGVVGIARAYIVAVDEISHRTQPIRQEKVRFPIRRHPYGKQRVVVTIALQRISEDQIPGAIILRFHAFAVVKIMPRRPIFDFGYPIPRAIINETRRAVIAGCIIFAI
jgi:hypothetical protein